VGEERLLEAIRQTHGLSASGMTRHAFAAVDASAAGTEQHDDMTLVVIRATEGQPVVEERT
jgi:serine phosphatase RsbU (regulator of sigma subunit)